MNKLLTVFIPTFNRPTNCIQAVRSVLESKSADFEICVISNSPNDGLQEYFSANIDDDRLRFYYNPINIGFKGSFFRFFELVKSNYMMFLSDEDGLQKDYFDQLLSQLQLINTYPTKVGYIVPSVYNEDGTCSIKHRDFYHTNKNFTLAKIFDLNSYISGTIFNLTCFNIDEYRNEINHPDNWYPHIYMRLSLTMRGYHAVTTSFPFIIQGKEAEVGGDAYSGANQESRKLNSGIYGYQSRVKQELFFETMILPFRKQISWWAFQMLILKSKINFAHSLVFSYEHYQDITRKDLAGYVYQNFIKKSAIKGFYPFLLNRLVLLSIFLPFVYKGLHIFHSLLLRVIGLNDSSINNIG